jgi:hypothetical protein
VKEGIKMAKNALWSLLFSLLVLSAAGCMSTHRHNAWLRDQPVDSWYHVPQSFGEIPHVKGGNLIADDKIFEVTGARELEAEKMLESNALVELSAEAAQQMVGETFHSLEGCTPYLARGLFLSKGTGRWQIYELGDKLEVSHMCLGKHARPIRRQAVVLLLKTKPAEVFVTCEMAE